MRTNDFVNAMSNFKTKDAKTLDKKFKFIKERRPLSEKEEVWKRTAFKMCIIFLALFVGQLLFYTFVFNINDWVYVLLLQIVLIMPGYLANAGMLIVGGGKPMDGGKICKDGRRLFGPGKTWRGFILGPLLIGIPIALAIHGILFATWGSIAPYITNLFNTPGKYVLFQQDPQRAVKLFEIYFLGASSPNMFYNFGILFLRVTAIAFGTAIGDLAGSWLKRRLNKERGEPIWIVDQIDFVVFVLIFALPFIPIDLDFLAVVIFTLIFTPSLTVLSNTLTYMLGHKSVPW